MLCYAVQLPRGHIRGMGVHDMYGDCVGHFEPVLPSQSGGHYIVIVANPCQPLGIRPTKGIRVTSFVHRGLMQASNFNFMVYVSYSNLAGVSDHCAYS